MNNRNTHTSVRASLLAYMDEHHGHEASDEEVFHKLIRAWGGITSSPNPEMAARQLLRSKMVPS